MPTNFLASMDLIGSNKTKPHGQIDGNRDSLAYLCSKKRRFAFQTFTETPGTTPPILGFGITHQPHEGGDGAKCGAKFADTPCAIKVKVTSSRQMPTRP
jgi:hypothetical protein